MNAIKELTNLADFEEIERYSQAVQDYQNLQIDEDRFTALRLQQGVYGQRQQGVNMVRIKLPGGRLNSPQLVAIADILEQYVQHDVVHITTRQDIQAHYVPLGDTPKVLKRLADSGLTTREACGNTIRNVTSCALSGVCPRQHTDVNVHLDGAVQHFLRNPLNQQMPRKFKISFSACESDCAQSMMHDMGIVAVHQNGKFGFKVVAGGGLGHKPHEAIVVESFIEEKDLLLVMEALISLHNKYSDRVKRAKSRIKFLVDRFGPEGFVEKYREEFARTKEALAKQSYPQAEWKKGRDDVVAPGSGAPRAVYAQKQTGLVTFPIAPPIGNLTVKQLRGLAKLMNDHDLIEIRTTQDQNLILPNVPQIKVNKIREDVLALGLNEPQPGDNVVACPGTSTCRLGITSSPVLGPKLLAARTGADDLRIRVSGCHNGCAQPETGDIGIYGEGRRLHGKLIPHYQTYFGGDGMGGGALAIKGPSVPAARIETAVQRVRESFVKSANGDTFFNWVRKQPPAYFQELLADLIEVKAEDVPSVLRDHGHTEDFKVLQLGGGECAGASQVMIGSAFFDAAHEREYRNALFFQRKYPEAVKCAEVVARLIGQGVNVLSGGKKIEDLNELAADLQKTTPQLATQFSEFVAQFNQPESEFTEASLKKLFADQDQWTMAAAEYSLQRDRQLDLTGALPAASRAKQAA
jgi:sulfite reductase (NADPH) hemoprotein beta-component